jgi:hypothetical protein
VKYPPAVWLADVLYVMELTKNDPCGLSSSTTTERNRHRDRPYSDGIVRMYAVNVAAECWGLMEGDGWKPGRFVSE